MTVDRAGLALSSDLCCLRLRFSACLLDRSRPLAEMARSLCVVLAVLCSVCFVTLSFASSLPSNVNVIASNYTWAENLHFSADGTKLFTTELATGTVYMISPDGAGGFNKTQWLSDPAIGGLLGLASDPNSDTMFSVGHGIDASGAAINLVLTFSASEPGVWKQIAETPKKGNGLMYHAASDCLYTTSEGNFLPGDGSLYRVNVSTGNVTEIVVKPAASLGEHDEIDWDSSRIKQVREKLRAKHGAAHVAAFDAQLAAHFSGMLSVREASVSNLWGADGLWLDEAASVLYVGELFTGKVWSLSLPSETPLGVVASIAGLEWITLLDDFTLSAGGSGDQLVAANWGNSSVTVTSLGSSSPSNASTMLAGLNNPTSARWGPRNSSVFASSSLFVSEGKNLFAWQHDCRILEITNATDMMRQ